MMEKLNIFNKTEPVITFDVDWAPDYVIDYVAEKLKNLKIKATWFITHDSPSIQKLLDNSLFEIGLHPNFYNNSTQGNGIDDILKNLKKIVNDAKSIRTHGLYQSSEIFLKFNKYGIENDVSILFSNESNIFPHYSKIFKITRIPFYWEDDVEMENGIDWKNVKKHFNVFGLKIFNFHPIHIFLNSNNMKNYNKLKGKKYPNINEKNILEFKNNSLGTETFFDILIDNLNKTKTYTINEISKIFNEDRIK